MRKRMKKLIAMLSASAMLVASFAGCGQTAAESDTKEASTQAEIQTEEASTMQTAANDTDGDTRVIVDDTGAEVTLPKEIHRVVISSILPLPSVYCLFKGSADDVIGIHPSSMAAAENSLNHFIPTAGNGVIQKLMTSVFLSMVQHLHVVNITLESKITEKHRYMILSIMESLIKK